MCQKQNNIKAKIGTQIEKKMLFTFRILCPIIGDIFSMIDVVIFKMLLSYF